MAEIIEFKPRIEKCDDVKEQKLDANVELITDAILSSSLETLIRLGYNIQDNFDDALPSIILLKESIMSLQLKLRKEDHFLQDYAENVFIITDENS